MGILANILNARWVHYILVAVIVMALVLATGLKFHWELGLFGRSIILGIQ